MESGLKRALHHAALVGLLLFVLAAIGFGAALQGYSQIDHLLDVLGARGMVRANAYNLLGLILPGLLAGASALHLRQHLPADTGWPVRIGAQLLLLSTLGLVALGLAPVDPADLHNTASSWHATAWMLWWVAFAPGALLLGWGLRGRPQWRAFARICVMAAIAVLLLALAGVELLPAGLAQRMAFLVWWIPLLGADRLGRQHARARRD